MFCIVTTVDYWCVTVFHLAKNIIISFSEDNSTRMDYNKEFSHKMVSQDLPDIHTQPSGAACPQASCIYIPPNCITSCTSHCASE